MAYCFGSQSAIGSGYMLNAKTEQDARGGVAPALRD
jgi:hypothetical protein